MDLKKNRVWIGAAVLVVLLCGTVYAIRGRDDPQDGESALPELPEIDKDAVTRFEVTIGEGPTVVMAKRDGVFRVIEPVDAEADVQAIDSALEKLSSLEVAGIASTNPDTHERLEVADNLGVRVVAKAGDQVLIDIRIGAYKGGNTMVRLAGEDQVIAVRESIKFLFNKELKDWRDRRIVDVTPDDVRAIQITSENGTFHFVRGGEDDAWQPAEGQSAIERFGAARVQSHVATFARMRAMNFAAPDVTADAAGFATPTATVTLTVAQRTDARDGGTPSDAPTTTIVLELGAATGSGNELYARRRGKATLYTISEFIADRMRPGTDAFQNPEPGEEPPAPEMPMGAGMPMHGGPGGGQIPPEMMQQIQRQLQQQGGH
jgi:hypothetical protein